MNNNGLTLENAPIGTIAPAIYGGHWTRTERGWEWAASGSTFPRPGGDWTGALFAVPPDDRTATENDDAFHRGAMSRQAEVAALKAKIDALTLKPAKSILPNVEFSKKVAEIIDVRAKDIAKSTDDPNEFYETIGELIVDAYRATHEGGN